MANALSTISGAPCRPGRSRACRNSASAGAAALLGLPQENILYFLEKSAPRLMPWQRELLRIVRHIAQYFYPQGQTKVMNEGTATYVHYRIMNRLHERGGISDGDFLEFLQSHTNVVFQPGFDDPRFSGFNPYALGFAMMRDIEQIVTEPDDEDRQWFPEIAGAGDAMAVLRDIWANYRDESFISQYLSPRLMRQMRMFQLHDDPARQGGHPGRGDPQRARLPAHAPRTGAPLRRRLERPQYRGRRRRSRRRPAADPAS